MVQSPAMPKSLLVLAPTLAVAVMVAPACRPPARAPTSSVAEFTAPAAPGKEEKWAEPEPKKEEEKPKPAEPPPSPDPTSPPPDGGLGYTFGESKNKAVGICSQRGAWSKKGNTYVCSKPTEGAIFTGKPVLSFCDEKLCAVGVAVVVETGDYEAWKKRWDEMKKILVDLHGPPGVDVTNIDEKCQNEGFSKCLDDGTASAEATWHWKEGHRVSLTMGKKKSGEGPSAIRFAAIVESP